MVGRDPPYLLGEFARDMIKDDFRDGHNKGLTSGWPPLAGAQDGRELDQGFGDEFPTSMTPF